MELDKQVARKEARAAAEDDGALWFLDAYIKDHPTLRDGYPADPVSEYFEELYAQQTLPLLFDEVDADE